METGGSIPAVKRPELEVERSPSSRAKVEETMELFLDSSIRLQCMVLN
jgi:hypothetical protein